jgi:hypothetical protein
MRELSPSNAQCEFTRRLSACNANRGVHAQIMRVACGNKQFNQSRVPPVESLVGLIINPDR